MFYYQFFLFAPSKKYKNLISDNFSNLTQFFQQHEINSTARWRQKSMAINTSTLEKTAAQKYTWYSHQFLLFCFKTHLKPRSRVYNSPKNTLVMMMNFSHRSLSYTEGKWARQSWYYLNLLTPETGPTTLPQSPTPSSIFPSLPVHHLFRSVLREQTALLTWQKLSLQRAGFLSVFGFLAVFCQVSW